ncbi:MAG: N-acetylmuramoyl-L-alanine amidase [Polyangiaceae bacterium]|nr:N-acetylmuramoyl-L-alanine amidase [Polyangiaceae bacterium]
MQFIQAKNYTAVPAGRSVELVVIHTMEAAEKPGTALAVARWFSGPTAPKASAHYCIDNVDVVQSVREKDVAWAAPGANRNAVHLEHAGFAGQSTQNWADAYSLAMLQKSAGLCADICHRHGIPVVRLTPADLLAKKRGICGHIDVTKAFKKSTHVDPGKNFPWDAYLELVRAALADLQRDDDEAPTKPIV